MSSVSTDRRPSLEIRPAAEGDTGRILDLVRLSLGEGRVPRDAEYWAWKHESNPFGRSPCLLAEHDGVLVGVRAFMCWSWSAHRRLWRAVRAVDTATHPDWRGRGIFTQLTQALVERVRDDGVAFIFNTPNDKSRPGYLKMGWEVVGRLTVWIRVRRPLRMLGRRWNGAAPGAMDAGAAAGQTVDELLRDPDLGTLLRQAAHPPDRLTTPRTERYLRWRYAAVPGIEYRAAWRVEAGAGALLIFRHKTTAQGRELRLCEVLVGSGGRAQRIARHLVHDVARASGADYVTAMPGGVWPTSRLLLRCGFVPAYRLGPIMTVRPLDGDSAVDPRRRSHWSLSTGDVELF